MVIALALGAVSRAELADSRSPSSVARRYFSAISNGEAATALALAASPPGATDAQFLTKDVLAQQLKIAPLTDVTVTGTGRDGAKATVDVQYRLGFADGSQHVRDRVSLIRHGSSWRLGRVAGSVIISNVVAGSDRLTLVGRPISRSVVTLFPGALPVIADTTAVVVAADPSVRLTDSAELVSVTSKLSSQAKQQVLDGLDAALTRCLAAVSADPLCPVPPGGRPVPGSMHGSLVEKIADSDATITLSSKGKGLIDIFAHAEVKVSWKVWDFENQALPRSDSTTLDVKAVSSVASPQTAVWVAGNG
jgi:hypothetical protein